MNALTDVAVAISRSIEVSLIVKASLVAAVGLAGVAACTRARGTGARTGHRPRRPVRSNGRRLHVALALALVVWTGLAAAEHSGQVTATGVPIPGATVTASQGEKTLVTSTDAQGKYQLADFRMASGRFAWRCPDSGALTREVTVAASAEPQAWDLALLPFEEITRGIAMPAPSPQASEPARPGATPGAAGSSTRSPPSSQPAAAPSGVTGAFQRAAVSASAAAAPGRAASAPAEDQPPVDPVFGASDGFLVNGSVNNGAATPFAQSGAFGNNRRAIGPRYNFMFGLTARNSAWDASPPSFGGQLASQPDYHNLNLSGTFGGPLRIPGLIRNGPFFTLSYQRNTDQAASTSTALMPTAQQRSGDFSQIGVPIIDPATGQPFAGNVIPADRISPEAAALLAYYPLPNLEGGTLFNYPARTPKHFRPRQRLPQPQFYRSTRAIRSPAPFSTSAATRPRRTCSGSTTRTGLGIRRQRGIHAPGVTLVPRPVAEHVRAPDLHRHAVFRQPHQRLGRRRHHRQQSGSGQLGAADARLLDGIAGSATGNTPSTARSRTRPPSKRSGSAAGTAFTLGGDVRRQQLDSVSQQNPRGGFTFSGSATGSTSRTSCSASRNTSAHRVRQRRQGLPRHASYAAYVTDDFRFGPALTHERRRALGVRVADHRGAGPAGEPRHRAGLHCGQPGAGHRSARLADGAVVTRLAG